MARSQPEKLRVTTDAVKNGVDGIELIALDTGRNVIVNGSEIAITP